jgi:ketosteroid isomerase-like protein
MLLATRATPAAGRQATHRSKTARMETMKTRTLLAVAGLATGLITPAFSQDEVTPEIRQQIEALNKKFDEAINNHDPAGCAAYCIATAVVVTPVGTSVGQQEIEKCYAGVIQYFATLSHRVDKIAHLYDFYSDLCGFTTYSNNLGGGARSIIYTHEGDTWKIRVMVVKY